MAKQETTPVVEKKTRLSSLELAKQKLEHAQAQESARVQKRYDNLIKDLSATLRAIDKAEARSNVLQASIDETVALATELGVELTQPE